MFNITVNNISFILWWSVLLVKQEYPKKPTDLLQLDDKFYHIKLYSLPCCYRSLLSTYKVNHFKCQYDVQNLFYSSINWNKCLFQVSSIFILKIDLANTCIRYLDEATDYCCCILCICYFLVISHTLIIFLIWLLLLYHT